MTLCSTLRGDGQKLNSANPQKVIASSSIGPYLGRVLLDEGQRVVLHGVFPAEPQLELALLLRPALRRLLALVLDTLQLGLQFGFIVVFVVGFVTVNEKNYIRGWG